MNNEMQIEPNAMQVRHWKTTPGMSCYVVFREQQKAELAAYLAQCEEDGETVELTTVNWYL